MKTRINRKWHLAHPMPKNPTEEERLQWHLEHAKNCRCRPIPQSLIDAVLKADREATVPELSDLSH